ncbi:hypothetical protein QCE62_06980 [Caballeronia sp. LZ033]|uniref:hypothetical protein n=1 Tax=Caballeronia sp. LZ033 TaxID=3038566 RepID=UPI00285E645E|nr:hypothetical protein [Caballeronia sp. LZ033]MDR5813335.1 hypothetical protein [Caballeronia sp. LZ033]
MDNEPHTMASRHVGEALKLQATASAPTQPFKWRMKMAYYKNGNYLIQEQGLEFDALHAPGAIAPLSGIYRCEGCGNSAVSTKGHALPPQNHHQHSILAGAVQWRLVVKAHYA